MAKQKNNGSTRNSNESDRSEEKSQLTRRDILRGVSAGGVLFSVDKWSRPVIESVAIPAHAQQSIGLAGGDSEQVLLPEQGGGP